ncbi:MAG: Y-family DNA polymerase [Janthinobacterium lividum]
MTQFVALVDVNNFYASCEQVFNPALRHKPVIVLSNNDGCAISRSLEAKALNIKMATPYFQFKELARHHNIHICSSNYALYQDMSHRVMQILRHLSPKIEAYSIDEAFLDCSDLEEQDLDAFARHVRETIHAWTGLPVSVGISLTKTLAKVANSFAKKSSGLCVLTKEDDIDKVLQDMPIGELWGIGRNHNKSLISQGIDTVYKLKKAPPKWIRRQMSVVGERMAAELNGISAHQIEDLIDHKKMIAVSRSYATPITDKGELAQAINGYMERAAEKMRKQGSLASGVVVFVKTNRFHKESYDSRSHFISLPLACQDTFSLLKAAQQAFEKIYQAGYPYKKSGVCLTGLIRPEYIQNSLFAKPSPRKDHLMSVIDQINKRHGKRTVTYGAVGFDLKGITSRTLLSPQYTTRWDQLMTI